MMRERKPVSQGIMRVCLVLVVILGMSLGGARTEPSPAQLTVLFSGELNGKLEPVECPTCGGGLARRHTLVRAIRLEQDPVLLM